MINLSVSKNKNRSYNFWNKNTKTEYRKLRIGELKQLLRNYYEDEKIINLKNIRELKSYIKNKNKNQNEIFCEFIDEDELLLV